MYYCCAVLFFPNQLSGIDFFAYNDAKIISKEPVASGYTWGFVGIFGKGCFTLNGEYTCLFEARLGFSRSPQLVVHA